MLCPVIALEPVPEKCGRFSDKDRLKTKGIESLFPKSVGGFRIRTGSKPKG